MEHFVFCPPEKEGLQSQKVLEFIEYIKESRINLHSFIIMKNGKILTEAYYKPFDRDSKKRLYSCTKTIVSLAVGKLVGEGLISLDAPLVSYFPDITNPAPKMAQLTVRQALTMTCPKYSDSYIRLPEQEGNSIVLTEDWTKLFFSDRFIDDKPCGTLFVYDTSASYVLGELVYRRTGKKFFEYLRPEFDEIGVSKDVTCVQAPDGTPWGGSGFMCTTRDFAKIGELVLNKGNYRGKQLLPKEYMEQATSKMVDNVFDGVFEPTYCGYGYQIWIQKYGYALFGLGGQFAFCFPDKNFMFVCNSNTMDSKIDRKSELYAAVVRLYKAIGQEELPIGEVYKNLCQAVESLTTDKAFGKARSSWEEKVNGKTYELNENPMKISSVSFEFNEEFGVLNYVREGVAKSLKFGLGKFEDTYFPETHYYGMTITVPSGREFRTLATGSWTMENRILIATDICDTSIATTSFVFEFLEDLVAIQFTAVGEDILNEYNGRAVGKLEKNNK